MSFFHDQVLQFIINIVVAVLVGIAAVVTAVVIFRKQQMRRELTYKIILDTPVLSIRKEVKDKLKVLFNGKVVNDPQLLILQISNTGNVPIQPEDYKDGKPITIELETGTAILYSEIVETKPGSVKDKIKLDQVSSSLVLEPFLLNNKETVSIKVLLSQQSKINAEARFLGGQLLNTDELEPSLKTIVANTFFSILIILLIILIPISYIILYHFIDLLNHVFEHISVSLIITFILLLNILLFLISRLLFRKRTNQNIRYTKWLVPWIIPWLIGNLFISVILVLFLRS